MSFSGFRFGVTINYDLVALKNTHTVLSYIFWSMSKRLLRASKQTRQEKGLTHLDAVLDGEVVKLVGHFQHEQVVHGEEVENPAIHPE